MPSRSVQRTFVLAPAALAAIWLAPALTAAARADGPADFLVQRLELERFKTTIRDLAAFQTRFWNRPGNEAARDYLVAQLESYGYTVQTHRYAYIGLWKENVYATRTGGAHADRMYILSGHYDSYNSSANYDLAPGADDDASGVAAVLEAARVFRYARPDLSVRFILWNNEETGLNGSNFYVGNRWYRQGTPEEPRWEGMIALDMILYDHGPGAVPDADVEYNALHSQIGRARTFAEAIAGAMPRYGEIPAEVGNNMNNTDSVSFWNYTPAISIRENMRIAEIGEGSNPHWHRPTDTYETYSAADYEFGFNIVRMLVGGIGELAGAVPLGDLNCDQRLDFNDITPFGVALEGRAAYEAQYPGCDWLNGDCNEDGTVTIDDIPRFVGLLSS